MNPKLSSFLLSAFLLFSYGCKDYLELPAPTAFSQQTVVSGLQAPIGLALDGHGRFWVSESGTGENNARVSLLTPDGQRHIAFTGFSSVVNNGAVEGIGHVVYQDGTLYILDGGAGKLYTVDVAAYQPDTPSRSARELSGEDIGTFVRAQQLTTPINTNLYNLIVGPDGSLYITDSGANAIIRRDRATGALSVFARLPNVTAAAEAVPTSIVYDGRQFLVSTLSGFPFAAGVAKIYQVSRTGVVGDYKTGFTTLTALALMPNKQAPRIAVRPVLADAPRPLASSPKPAS